MGGTDQSPLPSGRGQGFAEQCAVLTTRASDTARALREIGRWSFKGVHRTHGVPGQYKSDVHRIRAEVKKC